MNIIKRSAAVLLCALMILPALAACSEEGQNPAVTTNADTQPGAAESTAPETTVEETTLRSQVKDSVPEDLKFDGQTVRVYHRDAANVIAYDLVGTDNSGDYVKDAVWYRNQTIENRLGVTFSFTPVAASGISPTASAIRAVVMSNSDEFDYIVSTGNTVITQSMDTYMRDLTEMPYADYNSTWWWKEAMDSVSLDGKSYRYLFGDMLIYNFIQTGVVYYNKALYEDVFGNPDEPYELVMNGEWTIDKLTELTAAAYADTNGNGIEDVGDRFGSLRTDKQTNEMTHFLAGLDLKLYHRDENGSLIIDFDQEAAVTAIEKLSKYNNDTVGVFHSDKNIDGGSGNYFKQRYSVFFPSRLYQVIGTFRDMEDPYGILPYPKMSVEQENYISLFHNSGSVLCVPQTVSDERMNLVGAVLEASNAESWRTVTPLFLESALKMKYSQDEMSGKVIDIVVSGVTKNTLHEYEAYTSDIFSQTLINSIVTGNNNFASAYKKLQAAAQKTWDKKVDSLK